MSEPFENGLCDGCWEKANVKNKKEWEFCRICPERATDDSPWCAEHSTAGRPLYISFKWSEHRKGYLYTVYESEQAMNDGKGGACKGLCTGTLQDAFEMAYEMYVIKFKK